MQKMPFSLNLIRAFGSVIPAIIIASLVLHTDSAGTWLGALLTYVLAVIVLSVFRVGNLWGYTFLTTILSTFGCAIAHTVVTLHHTGHAVGSHFFSLLGASGIFTALTFGIFIPAWLIFVLADYLICKGICPKMSSDA